MKSILAAACLLCCASSARASIVERVVAVVGEQQILMSDVHRRARPYLQRIHGAHFDAVREAAAEGELYKEVLDRMIDERIEEQAAEKARLTVAAEEVEAALSVVARAAHLDVPALLAEAEKQGLREHEYREELRRQLLEGKVLQLRTRPGVDGWEAARYRWLREQRRRLYVDVRL